MIVVYNIMARIDLKDRKILYQLDIDSRQPLSKIGKKVGLPKTVVAYRINKLKKMGIIKSFYTVIDAFKLGYTSLRFYLSYQYTTPEIEKEIVNYFKNNKYTWWLGTFEGRFDLAVIMWVKDLNDFYSFWKVTLKKFRHYFQEQVFSLYVMLYLYRYSYLLKDYDKSDRTKFEITGGGKKVETDDLDFQILKLIAENARMPVTKIAKNLNSTVTVINYRMKKLTRLGVIQGFRVNYDFSKLGFQWFKIDIDLKKYEQREQIINYVKTNPNLIIIDESAGVADLELEFHLENLGKLHEIMNNIIIKFPDAVKNYRYIYAVKVHKMHYMPAE